MVHKLRERGVTIILTTHYIEEAQQMADRIGIIHKGSLIEVEDKRVLMQRLGKKQLHIALDTPLSQVPPALTDLNLELSEDGTRLIYTFNTQQAAPDGAQNSDASEQVGIATLLERIGAANLAYHDLSSRESTLEEIFVGIVDEQERGGQTA